MYQEQITSAPSQPAAFDWSVLPPAEDALELTILMPCLNEAETLATCIAKAKSFLDKSGIAGEVVIADNGSTDGSIAIAESLGARVVHVPVRGYGAALAGGIGAARGTYVIMGDADDSYDFTSLMPFVDALRQGNEIVVGNRFRGGIEKGAMPFLHRYLGNPVLSFLGRLFFDIPVGDFHCGLRGFNRRAVQSLGLKTTGMEFASEMIVRSGLERLRIAEVPTTLKPDGRSRPPHLKTWRDGWRHLKFLLMFSPKWLYFVPGLALTSLGLVLSLALLFGPIQLGAGLELDLNSFLASCLLTVMGIQVLTFGALARYHAALTGMLPQNKTADRIVAWCKTDRMALAALALILAGGGIFASSLLDWARTGFGHLTDPMIPRLVAAGLSLVVIGIQTGFAGFLFGIFDIKIAKRPVP